MHRWFHSKLPLVKRDIPANERLLRHLAAFGAVAGRDRQPGRFATHDRVAMCLLRKDLESALPVRRELRITRNRRRLKLVAGLCVLWWLAGRFLFG